LQEAGGKISRDSIKHSYETFTQIINMVIELIRQYYVMPRLFRITGENNSIDYTEFDNSSIVRQDIGEIDENGNKLQRLPIFDIVVKAQKSNPFATAAQNEMMMNLYKLGAFDAERADASLIMLEGMSFEGKDKLIAKIKDNQVLLKTVKELTDKLSMMEAMLAQKDAQQFQGGLQPMTENTQGDMTV
jgi:hypothetical protein